MTDTPVLELHGASKRFGAVQALFEVDFHVSAGEVMALVGDNGAGKSTLIKRIAGIYPFDGGDVRFDGDAVHIHGPKDAARLGIEVVYQDLALCDNLDVVQNTYLDRELVDGARRLDETTMEARAQDTLRGLSVTTLSSVRQTLAGLSGGQRQSVAVAKAVMWNSKLVILDEPTAALGIAQAPQVLELVKRLGEQGSFVVTLAGLLAWNGVVLPLIGSRGTVILQNDFVIGLANDFTAPGLAWILAIACTALYAGVQLVRLRSGQQAGVARDPLVIIGLRIAGPGLALAIVVAVANQDRGVPYVGILVGALPVCWSYVLNRTRFGRHVYAVGGNQEGARRAGINVDQVKIACFAIASVMAVLGGIILASRLRSVDTNTGGGTKFVVTGGVLLLAVTVHSISRRGRKHSGRA